MQPFHFLEKSMGTQLVVVALVLLLSFYTQFSKAAAAGVYSSKLIHGFSDEVASIWASKGKNVTVPESGSAEHMRVLLTSDLKRQKLKLGSQNQLLVPSEGSETFFYGNDMGWYKVFSGFLILAVGCVFIVYRLFVFCFCIFFPFLDLCCI